MQTPLTISETHHGRNTPIVFTKIEKFATMSFEEKIDLTTAEFIYLFICIFRCIFVKYTKTFTYIPKYETSLFSCTKSWIITLSYCT